MNETPADKSLDGQSKPEVAAGGEFPTATVSRVNPAMRGALRAFGTRVWLVTAVCLVVAVALVVFSFSSRGARITVHFQQGHGIKAGDTLRHRGIEVGRIVSVVLSESLEGVAVEIELDAPASGLAREGSQFWIQRPRVGLSGVSGLDTVVGANYVAVERGADRDAPSALVFQGLETPLRLSDSDASAVTIRFRSGHGLDVGDVVKYRGIVVGEVTGVALDEELQGVDVGVRLVGAARYMARVGSRFWVERPSVQVSGIRGLDTLVGGRYISVMPGPEDAEPRYQFDGLEIAPTGELPEGGLEVILESPQLGGLNRGAPVTYRGLRVGHIVSVHLATDSASVEARAYIEPAYTQLVCQQTQFWSRSGFDFSIGLSGVKLDAESLSTIALGGVAFATPDEPGDAVKTGHRFPLKEKPDKDVLDDQPRIPIGNQVLPEGLSLPHVIRASLRWRQRKLGINRQRQRQGWVLPLDNDRVIGPAELLSPVDVAIDGTQLELAGVRSVVTTENVKQIGVLAIHEPGVELPGAKAWPMSRVRRPTDAEDCLLVTAAHNAHLPLSASRVTAQADHWDIDAALPIDADHHGASVVATSDGKLIGILLIDSKGHWQVALVP